MNSQPFPFLSVFISGTIAALVYFIPTIIAIFRKKRNVLAIFALNLFLGVTGIGWVVALIWALTEDGVQVEVKK